MQQTGMLLLDDEHLRSIVNEYATNSAVFLAEFAAAWTQLIVADRFDGPTGTTCTVEAQVVLTEELPVSNSGIGPFETASISLGALLVVSFALNVYALFRVCKRKGQMAPAE